MSSLIDLNWLDRQRIREQMRIDMLSRYNFTPVLLMYWTRESLNQFLIPASKEELECLKMLHGLDENSGLESDLHKPIFNWLKQKISYKYQDDVEESKQVNLSLMTTPTSFGAQGEWREKYFIDITNEDEKPLPPVTLPPGTIIIITGIVL